MSVETQTSKSGSPFHITSKIAAANASALPFWSVEYFPPKTEQGLVNLCTRIARIRNDVLPSWTQITWGAGGTTCNRSLELAARIQNGRLDPSQPAFADDDCSQSPTGIPRSSSASDVCLHLTCTNVQKESLDEALNAAKKYGIRNILALRGDPPRGEEYWVPSDLRFQHAIDLVRYIREQFGDYFCIGVAGYPEGHCDAVDRDISQDINHLREKQEAGAQFIVTQLFYDVNVLIKWYKQCRESGITIPIIPGVMPIQNYQSFRRITHLCKVHVPAEVLDALEPIRFDDAAVKDYGVKQSISMISRIYLETDIRGFHICTLNLEKSVRRVLEGLDWVDAARLSAPQNGNQYTRERKILLGATQASNSNQMISDDSGHATPKDLKTTTSEALRKTLEQSASTAWPTPETATWDEFPNGRWGDARSPAYGEIDGYGASLKVPPSEAHRIWGYPVNEEDISKIFTSYLLGEINCIPWCDLPLFNESLAIRPELLALNSLPDKGFKTNGEVHHNSKGWWTVGSQPAVDGVSSADPTYGFGPRDGYVYQKAFVEFFASEEDKNAVVSWIQKQGQGFVSYFAGNVKGDIESNMGPNDVNAVTWGVFPGQEVAQTTIIERESFSAWRDEAFAIWAEWELLFAKRSPTRELLQKIQTTRWLVTVVHHDYKNPNALWDLLQTVPSSNSSISFNR